MVNRHGVIAYCLGAVAALDTLLLSSGVMKGEGNGVGATHLSGQSRLAGAASWGQPPSGRQKVAGCRKEAGPN